MRHAIYRYLLLLFFFRLFPRIGSLRSVLLIFVRFPLISYSRFLGKKEKTSRLNKKKYNNNFNICFKKKETREKKNFFFIWWSTTTMPVAFLSMWWEPETKSTVHLALPQTHNGGDQPIRWFLYFRLILCTLFFFLRRFFFFYFMCFYTFLWFISISTCWSVLIIVCLTCVYSQN